MATILVDFENEEPQGFRFGLEFLGSDVYFDNNGLSKNEHKNCSYNLDAVILDLTLIF